VMTQLNFVISLSFAARLSVGDVTLYTIAFFGGAVVIAITASAAAIVLAAPVAQTWDGDAAALLPHLRTIMRAGLMLIGPAVAVALLVGDDFIDLLLGSSFSAADADNAIAAFAALTGLFVGILAIQLPLLAAYARQRYGAVAAVSIAASVVHVGASAIAVELGSIAWLGAAASVSALTLMVLMMWLVHGADAARAVGIVVRECAVLAVACLVSFGPVGVAAAALGSGAWDLVAAIAGLAIYAIVLRRALPGHAAVAHRMLEPLLPARARPVAA
jgi:O-antigen/teichoic acid export membrane protein